MSRAPRIVYVQYADPALYPPLEHSSRIFADRGWKVLFLGIGAWGAPGIHLPPHTGIKVRYLPFCPPGILQKFHYFLFCAWLLFWVVAFRAQWVYCSDPLVCPAARLLSRIPTLRMIYHEHDAPGKQDGAGALLMSSRKVIANRAWLNILPNEHRAEQFRMDTGTTRPIQCVWNCPRREEIASPRAAELSDDIWILYHGSLVPDRLPLIVLEALASLPEKIKLRIIGYETIGSVGYTDVIRTRARNLSIPHRIELLKAMPRHQLLTYASASDIGLSFMPMTTSDINMRAMTGASNKAFDYMARGMALLVSELPDWISFFVQPGYALSCDPADAGSIAGALGHMAANPSLIRAMGESARKRVEEEWNYEAQFAPVYAAIAGK